MCSSCLTWNFKDESCILVLSSLSTWISSIGSFQTLSGREISPETIFLEGKHLSIRKLLLRDNIFKFYECRVRGVHSDAMTQKKGSWADPERFGSFALWWKCEESAAETCSLKKKAFCEGVGPAAKERAESKSEAIRNKEVTVGAGAAAKCHDRDSGGPARSSNPGPPIRDSAASACTSRRDAATAAAPPPGAGTRPRRPLNRSILGHSSRALVTRSLYMVIFCKRSVRSCRSWLSRALCRLRTLRADCWKR